MWYKKLWCIHALQYYIITENNIEQGQFFRSKDVLNRNPNSKDSYKIV